MGEARNRRRNELSDRFRPTSAAARVARSRVATAARVPDQWGWLPTLSFLAAAGLLAVAASYALVGSGAAWSQPLLWIGLVLIAVPTTLRQASSSPTVRERVGLVVVMGLMLQLVHLVRSPAAFTSYDELLHFRSLADILGTGHLFQSNPLLLVSPLFPGLETLTAAVVQVTGADPFVAANVVLASVRIFFAVGLFGLYREVSGSARVAGLATAMYMLNPNFTFFDSAFSYETMAITFIPALLLLVATRARVRESIAMTLTIAVAAATLAVTHHITTYAAAGMFLLWLVVAAIRRRVDQYQLTAVTFGTAVVVGAAIVWLGLAGQVLISYLAAPLASSIAEIGRLITTGEGRVPFQSATGQLAAPWERIAGLGAAGLLTLAIPVGLDRLRSLKAPSSLALALALISLAYPASLVARLTPTGSEAAGRSLGFIFFGLAFVVALAVTSAGDAIVERARRLRPPIGWSVLPDRSLRLERAWHVALAALVVTVTLAAGVIGAAPASRFPGPYLVGADSRSIDNQSVDAATWVRETLGPNRRIAADRVNRLLMGTYARADVVFHGATGIETWQIFVSSGVGATEVARIARTRTEYIVIDRRLSTSLPLIPFYYEEGEIFGGKTYTKPISPAILAKWDLASGVDRIYDTGDLQLYDVRRLANVP